MGLDDVRQKRQEFTFADGTTRTLSFTLNDMADLEDKYGSFDDAMAKVSDNSMSAIRFMCWLMCNGEGNDTEISERELGDKLDMGNIADFIDVMGDVMQSSLPASDEEESGATPNIPAPNPQAQEPKEIPQA